MRRREADRQSRAQRAPAIVGATSLCLRLCVLTEEHDRCQSSNDDSVGGLDGAILQAAIPEQPHEATTTVTQSRPAARATRSNERHCCNARAAWHCPRFHFAVHCLAVCVLLFRPLRGRSRRESSACGCGRSEHGRGLGGGGGGSTAVGRGAHGGGGGGEDGVWLASAMERRSSREERWGAAVSGGGGRGDSGGAVVHHSGSSSSAHALLSTR
jgi:hypothetical protein